MIVEKEITDICVGDYVVEITKQHGNFKLKSPGHIKNTGVIKNLAAKGVITVNIDTDLSITQSNQPISPELQAQRAKLAQEVKHAKHLFDESKKIQAKVFSDAQNGCELNLAPVIEITNQAVETIFDNADALACVINIREKDAYLLEHSIAVSVLMTIFARYLDINKDIVQQLAVGAFLHDVGKIMIPDHILNKPGKLTDDEFEIMKTHASHSIDIIKKAPGISSLSIEVAALHHEKLDGNGYPNGVKGDDISLYGRMISICDIFDALTANRCYKEGFPHVKAFTILRELAKENHLDATLVDQFIRCIGVYPVGALVELNSNKIAIVEQRNPDDPIKPKVRSFYSTTERHYVHTDDIDLSKSDDFIIKNVRADDFDLDMNKIVEFLLMQG
jgi:HD-GYP domain-containing protein (c-di-GMP phosphodiesterase class II)